MGHLWVKNCVSCSRYTPKVWLARGSWNKNSLTWEGFKRNLRKGWWFSHKMLLSDSFVSFKLGYLRVRFEAISRGSSFFKPIKWPNHQSPNCFSFFRRWFLQFAWIIFFPLVFHIARVFFFIFFGHPDGGSKNPVFGWRVGGAGGFCRRSHGFSEKHGLLSGFFLKWISEPQEVALDV